MDFTFRLYRTLLETLKKQGFSFLTFSDFILNPSDRVILLRHDVDKLPGNSLRFARIQAEMGLKGTYYFRIVPGSFNVRIIREIYEMGHEVGYHYEDLSFAWAKLKAEGRRRRAEGEELEKEVVDIGIELFKTNLERLRKIVPVRTICMHGSPMSRWDSRLLWKYYDYRDFGIVGEPYFDVDFDEVMYLTDTGRRWDGEAVSVRDKAQGSGLRAQGKNSFADWKVKPVKYREETKSLSDKEAKCPSATVAPSYHRTVVPFPKFHSTFDIIKAAEEGRLPDKIMMTFHPQRWSDKPVPWVKELVWQNVKNVGKFFLVRSRK